MNVNSTLRVPLTLFTILGLWMPNQFVGLKSMLYHLYTILLMVFVVGIYLIVQFGDLCQVWGNVPLMTATMFLIFTNLALSGKILNMIMRKTEIQNVLAEAHGELVAESREEGRKIVESCERETNFQLYLYICLSYATILGWAASAEKNQLPLRAWYPYDASKTPAYQITYAHQCIAVSIAASLNISVDTVVTTLMCQCRCRLQLLALSLKTLYNGLPIDSTSARDAGLELILIARLRMCIKKHEAALEQARLLQAYFSAPIFGQVSVSMVIICVTAYQLAFETMNLVRIMSMTFYITVMMLQVFLYCYQGNELLYEIQAWIYGSAVIFLQSQKIKEAAYEWPWYFSSCRVRRILLVLIERSHRVVKLRAGGFTDLNLASFMAIIKASYTFFTVLQQFD